MLTKFNSSNDMNAIASDAINSYINDGYRIDAGRVACSEFGDEHRLQFPARQYVSAYATAHLL